MPPSCNTKSFGGGFFIFPSPGLREGRGRVVGRIKRVRVTIRHLWL
ncbi:hypothetical protein SPAB_05269 [Salmonella enterica subsp. enterica serovar Paratyphi B str. SPB7]|uniref:Uncharacterized protein n=1 Tax=Salmonella paratyphi B (strain ATCC BAA-1250 / SPB7) TaxID=1016998 RepID=A0A6C6Z9V5_SALPB|nr:hypothetical protein SPAB_05269 [Salmonella enterica subsp. enterica serovar Paratyphi B str. SPB7]